MGVIFEGIGQVVPTVLQVVGTVVGIIALNAVLALKDYLIEKVGEVTYNRAVEVAKGMYVLLEDEFKQVEKAGDRKAKEMKRRLLNQFPQLTEDELDAINKIVWESFNKAYTKEPVLEGVELETGVEILDE